MSFPKRQSIINGSSAALEAIIGLIAIFNYFSGIVAGIWLIAIGKWEYVILGLIISFIMPYFYAIASLILIPLAGLLTKVIERKQKSLSFIIGLFSILLSNGILLIWVFYVFNIFVLQNNNHNNLLMIIWGYSVTLGPLGYMASKEDPDSNGTVLGVIFSLASYLILAITTSIFGYTIGPVIIFWLIYSIIPMYFLRHSFNKEEVNTSFCHECGKSNELIAKFCKYCGVRLID